MEVGRRLARLARLAQVIVVTHLPQVAAFADTHLVVEKADDGSVTRSGVIHLDRGSRVRELSRMLAGLEDSELGQAHAEELLGLAAAPSWPARDPRRPVAAGAVLGRKSVVSRLGDCLAVCMLRPCWMANPGGCGPAPEDVAGGCSRAL